MRNGSDAGQSGEDEGTDELADGKFDIEVAESVPSVWALQDAVEGLAVLLDDAGAESVGAGVRGAVGVGAGTEERVALLAEAGVSIDAVLQREADEVGGEGSTQTDLIILTHDTREGTMDAVIAQMQALPTVLAPITRIRKEELN